MTDLDLEYDVLSESASVIEDNKLKAIYILQNNATILDDKRKAGEICLGTYSVKEQDVIIVKANSYYLTEVDYKLVNGKQEPITILLDGRYTPVSFNEGNGKDKAKGMYTQRGHLAKRIIYVYVLAFIDNTLQPMLLKIRYSSQAEFNNYMALLKAEDKPKDVIKTVTTLGTKLVTVNNRQFYSFTFKKKSVLTDKVKIKEIKELLPSNSYQPLDFVEKETQSYLNNEPIDVKVIDHQ